MLLNDVSTGGLNPTGLSSASLQVPLRDLKRSLTHLIELLCSLIDSNDNVDFEIDISYSAPLQSRSEAGERRARKRYEISKDQLKHLCSLFFFHQKKFGRIFRVSTSTI